MLKDLDPRLRRVVLWGGLFLILAAAYETWSVLHRRAAANELAARSDTVVQGVLGKQKVQELLVAAGSPPEEASSVAKALARRLGGKPADPRSEYKIVYTPSGEFEHLTLQLGKKRLAITNVSKGVQTVARNAPPAQRQRRYGKIQGTLWASLRAAGVPLEVAQGFADAFRWSVDWSRDRRDGDRFAVVWVEKRAPGGRVFKRQVLAARYKGKTAGDRVAVLFNGDLYDKDGAALRRMFLRAPLPFFVTCKIASSALSKNSTVPVDFTMTNGRE